MGIQRNKITQTLIVKNSDIRISWHHGIIIHLNTFVLICDEYYKKIITQCFETN